MLDTISITDKQLVELKAIFQAHDAQKKLEDAQFMSNFIMNM